MESYCEKLKELDEALNQPPNYGRVHSSIILYSDGSGAINFGTQLYPFSGATSKNTIDIVFDKLLLETRLAKFIK